MDLFETERIGDCMNISKFTQKSQEVVQGCEKIAMAVSYTHLDVYKRQQ